MNSVDHHHNNIQKGELDDRTEEIVSQLWNLQSGVCSVFIEFVKKLLGWILSRMLLNLHLVGKLGKNFSISEKSRLILFSRCFQVAFDGDFPEISKVNIAFKSSQLNYED